jgi:hypothetical protein
MKSVSRYRSGGLQNFVISDLSFVIAEPRARMSREPFLQRHGDFNGSDCDPFGFIGFKSAGD